jgi:nicotinamide-nucleotide amidase
MLPGPPGELIPIFNEQVVPFLSSQSDCVLLSKNIHFFGIGESALEDKIKDIMTTSQNPTVAPYCKEGEVRLRVTAEADSEDKASKMCDEMIDKISDTEVGDHIYGIDVGTLEGAVVEFLHKNGLTLSAAESCTGGLIAKRITDISGCSDVFFGGCVTYTNEVKQKLLGVSADTLEKYGAVSEETAKEMAKGVRTRLGTDIGLSATGVAGPTGGTAETPVGTVYIGISTKDGEQVRRLSLSAARSRDYIRKVSASNAYDMVLKFGKSKN